MKNVIFFLLTLVFSTSVLAVPVDTSLWSVQKSPNGSTGSSWTSTGGNQAIQNLNSYGTLVSDFTEDGDFTFSGTMRATTPQFNDDDILGIVFGWSDDQNHYRLGWEQGGYNDTGSGASGMFLVREVAGVSTVLFQQEIFWSDNVDYDFFAGRSGNEISFSLNGITQTFTDTTFMSGHVGFYTESQTATFSGLASVPEAPPTETPEPFTLAIMGFGLVGLGISRRRNKN